MGSPVDVREFAPRTPRVLRRRVRGAVAAALLIGFTAVRAARAAPAEPRLSGAARIIEAVAKRLIAHHHFPSLSLGVATRDGRSWNKAWGYSNVGSRVKARPESVYATASLVKPMTALALLSALAESGTKPALDADELGILMKDPALLSRNLPANVGNAVFPPAVADLLAHRAFVTNGPRANSREMLGLEGLPSLESLVCECRVRSVEEACYCNDCYLLAGYVLGAATSPETDATKRVISHRDVEREIGKYVWDRLGMADTRIKPSPLMVERLALPYRWDDYAQKPQTWNQYHATCSMNAFTTVPDLVTLVTACLRGGAAPGRRGLVASAVEQSIAAYGPSPGALGSFYGHGWTRYVDDARDLILKDGYETHILGRVVGDLKSGSCAVALTNCGGNGDGGKALARLLRLALDVLDGRLALSNFELPASSGDPTADFAGEYESALDGSIDRVRYVDGIWTLELPHELGVLTREAADPADTLTLLRGWGEPTSKIRLVRQESSNKVAGFELISPIGATWKRRSSSAPPLTPGLDSYAGRWRGARRFERPRGAGDQADDGGGTPTPETFELDVRPDLTDREIIAETVNGAIGATAARVVRAEKAGLEVKFDLCGQEDQIRLVLRPTVSGAGARLEGTWRQGAALARIEISRTEREPDGELEGTWDGTVEVEGAQHPIRVVGGAEVGADPAFDSTTAVVRVSTARWRGAVVDFSAQRVGESSQEFVGRLRADTITGTTRGPVGCGVFEIRRRRS